LLAGVAGLTNTTLLAVFPFFWVWLWVNSRRRGRDCGKRLLASVAIFVLALMPWTIRNYEVFHRLMPVRDNFGLELWLGYCEGETRCSATDFPFRNPTEYNRLGELRFMEEKGQAAFTFIRQHPGEFLRLSADRFFRYWTAPETAVWLPLSVLAWVGMILAVWRKGLKAVPYAIILLMFPLIYYVTHTFNSYRHPTEPAMLILAAYAIVSIGEALLGKLVRRASMASSGYGRTS
jgi:4-amino-4-deoxy-L-arabinose transferase-like glycosyltransferase